MKICAVIPAAGLGSRLGMSIPKLFLPLSSDLTVWTCLREKLLSFVNHINIIISPHFQSIFENTLKKDIKNGLVSLSLQPHPIGMGDAVFCGYPIWSKAQSILIIWGDQVYVSNETFSRMVDANRDDTKNVILPLVKMHSPYVQYIFRQDGTLLKVNETREGDSCDLVGLADIGTFLLSVTDLLTAWQDYTRVTKIGARTGEINFLPFLPFLAAKKWTIKTIVITDPLEARGINTLDDLTFFQKLFITT